MVAQGVVSITDPLSDEHNVGGLEFTGITPLHAEIGDPITVWGDFVDGKIVANQIRNGLFVGSEPALVLAQGFLSEPTTGGEYTLIGSGAVAYTTQPQMIDVSKLVVRCIFEGSLDFQIDEPLAFGTEIFSEFCSD